MSNVIALDLHSRPRGLAAEAATLATSFAHDRRTREDVFWLKENAELLNVLETSGQAPGEAALSVYGAFYEELPARFGFFPQYYRFLLSICLDLEDLGLPGETGSALCDRVVRDDLSGAELSDLQRAEAVRLLARRGMGPARRDPGLNDRLRAFAGRSATFALPNKKAAYELTHIVFYLSEYGRRAPQLPPEAQQSLEFVGLLAWLEGNADLLAEVSIALRFAGWPPPPLWEEEVAQARLGFAVSADDTLPLGDDYHSYLMCHWQALLQGQAGFGGLPARGGRLVFHDTQGQHPALREVSQVLLAMPGRSGDWGTMRAALAPLLTVQTRARLDEAAQSSPFFESFFCGFARACGGRDRQPRLGLI